MTIKVAAQAPVLPNEGAVFFVVKPRNRGDYTAGQQRYGNPSELDLVSAGNFVNVRRLGLKAMRLEEQRRPSYISGGLYSGYGVSYGGALL